MFPFVLLEDALYDVERGFPHKNVLMEKVVSEDLDSSETKGQYSSDFYQNQFVHLSIKLASKSRRNTALPRRKWDVPPLHEAEHGQTHVVVEPVEALPGLRQLAEAVHQLVIQPLVLETDLCYSEVIGRDDLRIQRLFVGNVPGE